MDFSWLIWFLVFVVVGSIAFAIVKFLIMPAVAPGAQPYVWAVIGICLLIGLLIVFGHGYSGHGISFNTR
jgi:magnesium-transporting ATPase (P-type)